MVRRRWFLAEDIKRGSCDGTIRQRLVESILVNQPAARAVDETRPVLHFAEDVTIDQSTRLGRQRRMDREKIGAGVDVVERRQLDLQIARLFGRDERIVSDDLHAERASS